VGNVDIQIRRRRLGVRCKGLRVRGQGLW